MINGIDLWNYFKPFTHPNPNEHDRVILKGLTALKIVSYLTLIFPVLMLSACLASDLYASRFSLNVNPASAQESGSSRCTYCLSTYFPLIKF